MSKKSWTILIVIIILVIGVWIWFANSPSGASSALNRNNLPSATPGTSQPTMSAPANTSDTAIDQDLRSVDSQLNGLNSDSANIDTSLSSSAQSSQ